MNTIEIYNALSSHKITKHTFCGVYPIDKMPKCILIKPSMFVINTDKSNLPGTHWVAIYIPRKGYATYFDSYGLPPVKKIIIKFIKRHCAKIIYNKNMYQSAFSSVCGQYCCLFLLNKCQGKTLADFKKKFGSKNLIKNDVKALNAFNKTFTT